MFLRVRCSFYQASFYQREESGMVSIPFEASRLILTDIIFTLRFTRLLTFVFFIIFLLSYLLTFLNIYHGWFLFHIECKNRLRSKLKNRVFDHLFQWRLFKNYSFLLKALALFSVQMLSIYNATHFNRRRLVPFFLECTFSWRGNNHISLDDTSE